MGSLSRRDFVACSAAALADSQPSPIPVVDCHIHLFDQTRPQGAPYSAAPGNSQPALPARYRGLASPLGIVGAIEVEASPWIEDNLWVLEVEQNHPIMLGTIGNLQPDKPEFPEYLDRYRKNRLFLGIRYGNLWGYDLVKQAANPAFLSGLKLLQQAGLTLDTANPRLDLLQAVLRVHDQIPDLRIVVDHLPALLTHPDSASRSALESVLRDLAARPTVYIKVSEVLRLANGKPIADPLQYKPHLDRLFEVFGEDKLIFGSDWPNGPAVDHLPAIVKIMQDYFQTGSKTAAGKFFWKNSLAAYRWLPRMASQAALIP